MPVSGHSFKELLDGGDLWLLSLCNLDKDQRQSDKSALTHKISLVICQWRQKTQGFVQARS